MTPRELWIKTRLSDNEKAMFDELKKIYAVNSDSEMIRLAITYIHRKRPVLTPAPVAPKRKPKEDQP